MAYARAAALANLVGNDIHYMHILADGVDFDKSHNLADEYYAKFADEADYLMELSQEFGAPLVNPNIALQAVEGYEPERLLSYDYPTIIQHMTARIGIYVSALRTLRASIQDDSVQSWIDDTVRDWEKELNYRLARRGNLSVTSEFVNTGLDEHISALM